MTSPSTAPGSAEFNRWFADLHQRQTQTLTFQEIRRALQALSRIYVQDRHRLGKGAALDGAGKRAAFALFYGPLHWLTIQHIVNTISTACQPSAIVDLGCGTGVAGAAWATTCACTPSVLGVDTNPWVLQEARRTYDSLGLAGRTLKLDAAQATIPKGAAVVSAFTVNELSDSARGRLLVKLLAAASTGSPILIVEPIAKSPTPWWQEWLQAFAKAGARQAGAHESTWRFRAHLPEPVRLLDKAAGMRHQVLTARSLWLAP